MRRAAVLAIGLAMALSGVALAQGPTASVSGTFAYEPFEGAGPIRTVTVDARTDPLRGTWSRTVQPSGDSLSGSVTCLVVDGQDAWMAGPVDATSGLSVFFWMHDGGVLGGAGDMANTWVSDPGQSLTEMEALCEAKATTFAGAMEGFALGDVLFGDVIVSAAQAGGETAFEVHYSEGAGIFVKWWPAASTITVTIDDPATTVSPDYLTEFVAVETDEGFGGGPNVSYIVKPGDVVTLTDGITTKSHIVIDIKVTSVDVDADRVSGTVPTPNSAVFVYADGAGRGLTADALGNWMADFAVSAGEPLLNIVAGTSGGAEQFDADGDSTVYDWQARVAATSPPPPPNVTSQPALTLTKGVSLSQSGPFSDSLTTTAGTTVWYQIVVANPGTGGIGEPSITDSLGLPATCPATPNPFAAGATWTCVYSRTAAAGTTVDTATATGAGLKATDSATVSAATVSAATPTPAPTPSGEVAGAIATPKVTLPPTDTIVGETRSPGVNLGMIVLLLGGIAAVFGVLATVRVRARQPNRRA